MAFYGEEQLSQGEEFMKKNAKNLFQHLALGALVFLSFNGSAQAYQSAGCGLGAMIFKEDDFSQVFAASTNYVTFFNQAFGITSGTSECRQIKESAKLEQEMFVSSNFEMLTQELSKGEGEYVDAFATLLGCPREEFNTWTRENRVLIDQETPEKLLESVRTNVQKDQGLSKSCQRLTV